MPVQVTLTLSCQGACRKAQLARKLPVKYPLSVPALTLSVSALTLSVGAQALTLSLTLSLTAQLAFLPAAWLPPAWEQLVGLVMIPSHIHYHWWSQISAFTSLSLCVAKTAADQFGNSNLALQTWHNNICLATRIHSGSLAAGLTLYLPSDSMPCSRRPTSTNAGPSLVHMV